MQTTNLYLHSRFQIDQVDPRVFGGFIEHAGRCVYEGIYDPTSRHADEEGCRRDVLGALGCLGMTAMRYPGGNFASGYHWIDGIGPRKKRPTVRDLAWQSIEPNQFGTEEYLALCRKMGWTPMLTVNLGTGTPEEARNWVEYCNAPAGTKYADLRPGQPHGVKLWCLGNEMDGPWQLGHVPAEQYAMLAQQAAKMMKDTDRSIETVVSGSCLGDTAWDLHVLDYLGDLADYLSVHRYVGNRDNDTPEFLAIGRDIDRQLDEAAAVCRCAQAKGRRKKRANLCVDEWNVWYKNTDSDGVGKFAPHLLEEVYNLEDALVVAQFLISFIRHADTVKIANLAQVANVIAPILTQGEAMLIQSIFYPFEMFSRRKEGVSLQVKVDGPEYASKKYGQTPMIDSAAILNGKQLHVFAVNRSTDAAAEVRVELADAKLRSLHSAEIVCGDDPKAANSYEAPGVIAARAFEEVRFAAGRATAKLPALSVAAMTFNVD